MKRLIVIYSCMLLSCGAVLAELGALDDFNDNIMNPTNWYVNDPLLTETNGRVEFATTGTGTERGSWYWMQNLGSCTQDWSVSIDAFNASTPSGSPSTNLITLTARNYSNPPDSFSIGLVVDGIEGQQIWGGWNDYDGEGYFVREPISFQSAALRISYDATGETLSCAYNEGNGFLSLTNFNPSGWSTNINDYFVVGIACYAMNSEVLAGQVYADNFQAVTLPYHAPITNCYPGGAGFTLEWVPLAGLDSVVQWSTNLVDTPFTDLSVALPYPVSIYTDTVTGAESKCFYRVDLE